MYHAAGAEDVIRSIGRNSCENRMQEGPLRLTDVLRAWFHRTMLVLRGVPKRSRLRQATCVDTHSMHARAPRSLR